jgi:hypothetical protein
MFVLADQNGAGAVLEILTATDIDMVERFDQIKNLGGRYLDPYRPEEASKQKDVA